MDDETRDYSELKLDEEVDDEIDNFTQTMEINDETLLTVNEQIKEIEEEKVADKIEELKNKQNENKKLNKTLIILIIILAILALGLICYLLFFRKDNQNSITTNNSEVIRPSNDLEYTLLNQNQVSILCNKTSSSEKILDLKKGLIIECNLVINTIENINELYFDLNNSANLKIKEFKNDSSYVLINDKNTYLLKSNTPFNALNDKIKFYFEVININEKTAYVEVDNIIFKNNKNNYYKVENNVFSLPPKYSDEIFIYKQKVDNEVFYTDSKTQLNDESMELVDIYKCKTEECEALNNYKNYFVIYDNNLLIYNLTEKTKQTIKVDSSNFNYMDYQYEPISGKNGNILGILFEKNYEDNSICDEENEYCIETSISGFEVSYYSLNKNMFTIAYDYGFTGANIHTTYDKALLLHKDNKFGIFSYEDDKMIVELSKKYSTIEYDSGLNLVKFGVSNDNKEYYYSYYDLDTNSFNINTKNLKSINNSNQIYYIKDINRYEKTIYMLFNSKGKPLTDIPYIKNLDLEIVGKTLVVKNKDSYNIYNLNGNFIETSQYKQSGLKVLKQTQSYLLALNSDNKLIVTDTTGKTIVNLMPSDKLNEIYEINTMSIVKCEELNNTLEIIITNPNMVEENKNAYKFTIKDSSNVAMEYTYFE